jgi:acyl carrier protein
MIPLAFVTLPTLPVTNNGKIDRQALSAWELEWVRAPGEIQAPLTETERCLAEIWQQVLNVSPIAATDNFFDLGGDSLAATRVLTLVEAQFGIALPASLLARAPTIARLASMLENRELPCTEEETGAVVPLQPHGSTIHTGRALLRRPGGLRGSPPVCRFG